MTRKTRGREDAPSRGGRSAAATSVRGRGPDRRRYNSWLTDQSISLLDPKGGVRDRGRHRTRSLSPAQSAGARGGRSWTCQPQPSGRRRPRPRRQRDRRGIPCRARGSARRARRDRRVPGPRRRPSRLDHLRHPRALRSHRPPAAVHRGDPRRRDLPRRLRLRGPDRQGLRPRSRDAARRGHRGRACQRARGGGGAAAEPALPQARPDRSPPGHLQGGDVAGRARRLADRRLPLDLERREPRAGPPLARRVRRGRRRDRHRSRG